MRETRGLEALSGGSQEGNMEVPNLQAKESWTNPGIAGGWTLPQNLVLGFPNTELPGSGKVERTQSQGCLQAGTV